jgi:hypothetical protein
LPTELSEKHVSSVSISETVKKHSNFVHFVALNVHIEMNLASSRSHCLYIFSVQHGSTTDERYAWIGNINSSMPGQMFLISILSWYNCITIHNFPDNMITEQICLVLIHYLRHQFLC